jgi:hypothetical protein
MRTTTFKVKILKTALLLFLTLSQLPAYPQTAPLLNAFAHNDYWHKHPLFDALDNGFSYIEADVFLINQKLIVAHLFPFFKNRRTLENLYLEPLFKRINQHKENHTYQYPITLMIDIKSGGNSTYAALKLLLEKYKDMLSSYHNGEISHNMVTVVLSGHRPSRQVISENDRMVFMDEDLRKVYRDTLGTSVYTMASCPYNSLLTWDGTGDFPAEEKQRLCSYVAAAHRAGKKIRLWASPENRVVWRELLSCGVDLINTDQLVKLRDFLSTTFASNTKVDFD